VVRASRPQSRERPALARGRDARTTHRGFRTSCLLTNQNHRLQLLDDAGMADFVGLWGRLPVRGAGKVGKRRAVDLAGAWLRF
jgi:hypothetical protein